MTIILWKKNFDRIVKSLFLFLDVLAEAVYLSVDPGMRTFADSLPVGVMTMIGGQVAKYDIKSLSIY